MCLIAAPFSAEAAVTYHFLHLWLLSVKSQSSTADCSTLSANFPLLLQLGQLSPL